MLVFEGWRYPRSQMPGITEDLPAPQPKAVTVEGPLAAARKRYDEERQKRLRPEGLKQFAHFTDLEKFRRWKQDVWFDKNDPSNRELPVPKDGDRTNILIMGAGFSGLTHAARLLEAGFAPEDIRLTDNASGFGGTWYWNRYPGLMCDIESYIYMPLLEETNYMPKHKYAAGNELREYANRIARQYKLTDRAWFRTNVTHMCWDENTKEWVTTLTYANFDENESAPMHIRSRFVIITGGFQLTPQVPQIEGMDKFSAPTFHTARWDYNLTGGSPTNDNLTKLKDKRVAIIGTGATAIQVVPALADQVKELYVFQRTPSAVDKRGNQETDSDWWQREVACRKGWQKERRHNFDKFTQNAKIKPRVNMVGDGWTDLLSYSAFVGNPEAAELSKIDMKANIEAIHALDFPRQEGIRKRTEEIVKDRAVAEKLKPWYPGWCKRPCFHDEYLQAFNKPNVTLVDTDGQGVDAFTEDGIVAAAKEYKVDILVLGTGYVSPFLLGPGWRCGVQVYGRNNADLEKKWSKGITTLHGMMSHDFPNMFWPALYQGGASPNFMELLDYSAGHIADILRQARARNKKTEGGAGPYKYNFTVETTAGGEEAYTGEIAAGAATFAAVGGCTPSYFNFEGEADRSSDMYKKARMTFWAKGVFDWQDMLDAWRAKGEFPELEIKAVV